MSDKEQIEKCIDVYYAGCCESDSNKIKEAFDNNAMSRQNCSNSYCYVSMLMVIKFCVADCAYKY